MQISRKNVVLTKMSFAIYGGWHVGWLRELNVVMRDIIWANLQPTRDRCVSWSRWWREPCRCLQSSKWLYFYSEYVSCMEKKTKKAALGNMRSSSMFRRSMAERKVRLYLDTSYIMGGAVAEWVRELALNEWRPDILPGRVRLPLRATLSSELWQFR